MSILWGLGACLELFLWFINGEVFFLVVAVQAAVFAVAILKGFKWVFWANLGILSLSLGTSLVQLQVPALAFGTSTTVLCVRSGVTLGFIAVHLRRSLQQWFGIRSTGTCWNLLLLLFVAGLTVLGQFVLPALRELRE